MKQYFIFGIALILAATAGFTLQRTYMSSEQQNLPAILPEQTSMVGTLRPEFALKDIEDTVRNINEWDGKVILLNFWATWCPPCKKEIPAFIALQALYEDKGFHIIGIAIDDEDAVKDYADTLGINYTIMAAELDAMELARRYGNRVNALPFSIFIGRDGKITHTQAGEISQKNAEDIIKKLL